MPDKMDPIELERQRLRRRLFALIGLAILLIGLIAWTTIAVLDANGIDAFDVIANNNHASFMVS